MTAHPEKKTPSGKPHTVRNVSIGVVALVCLGAGGYLLYQQKSRAGQRATTESQGEQQRTSVVTTAAAIRDFERVLVVQGNLESKSFAAVSPRVAGTIEAIFVEEGEPVVAGKTRLFQTDAANLEKNVQIKEHATVVARSSRREAAANLERVKVDLHKAELDYQRFERLREKQAVTADAFEQQQSRYQQLRAACQLAEAQVELAAAKEAQSEAELVIARKDLADAAVYAPIDGKVSRRFQEPGEMGSPGHPVVRIDNTSVVEVKAFLPAEYYALVVPGQTAMRIQASGADIGRHAITYKSPMIDPKLRTFEIKCVLTDPPASVAPGAMAQIVVTLEGRRGLGVPSQAIQQRGGRSVVFVVENAVARQVPVTMGIETDGWTEIREGDVKEGASVVTMGQYMVEPGMAVSVQQEEK